MDSFNALINAGLRAIAAAFSWGPPALSLAVFAVLAGSGMIWAFRKTSDQAKLQAVKRKLYAYLLELRVYSDEPSITWRTQVSLLRANLRYLGLALRPAVWIAAPLALLMIHLESFYSRQPLALDSDTVVTMRLRSPVDGAAPDLTLPPGVELTAPPVRIVSRSEISWRIRPRQAVSGELQFRLGGQTVSMPIEARRDAHFIPGRRVNSALAVLWHPDSPRVAASAVDWIDVRYPDSAISVFGLEINWIVWFLIVAMLAGLALKKPMKVVL
ncbi:MAG: hypothetical protein C5B51_04290 [Terriglobia bacterium]|nr:MAG: hypothetical protein C5B51_04290 [Terriglobia bacterium]